MSLNESERTTLVNLYLEKAWDTYKDAQLAANANSWGMAANRLYYALFHAVTALFVHDGIEVGSHRGIKAKLGQHYVLTGKMAIEHSQFLARMETLRDKADYNIMFIAKEDDVVPNLALAEKFIKNIENIVTTYNL